MSRQDERRIFEKNRVIYDSAKLKFLGVDGYDVYNCSSMIQENGRNYIFGRVEKREIWADSMVALFEEVGKDTYKLVDDSRTYQMEDPFVARINGEYIMGGTHVKKMKGNVETFYAYFYRGKDLKNLTYFTTGPNRMKDIRLIEKSNGKIGIFSRPRGKQIQEIYGSEAMIGYEEIDRIDDLEACIIEKASYLPDLFRDEEWGGCNQVYQLADGCLGIVGHISEKITRESGTELSYMNMAFVMNPETMKCEEVKIIGTRDCYPQGPSKKIHLRDCAFTSGIVYKDGKHVDLYSGLGDCEEGRITIDDPFKQHGGIAKQ